jgi:FAD/FMN-containing dehydrogenase/Fe-S oxidoreductase
MRSMVRFGGRTRRGGPPETDVDVVALEAELAARLRGEVRFDGGSRALYANDFSLYRHVPIGVVIPKDADDVIEAVAACRRHGAPILPRGTGTAPSGQSVNVAVVMDYSKYMNDIVELDPENRRARVQPGVICDELRDAAEEYDLTYGPDPATHAWCTFGGMIGNNSCGTHSVMAGKTNDNVEELDILLYDGTRMTVGNHTEEEAEQIIAEGGRKGEIYAKLRGLRDRYADLVRERYPDIPRRVSGYNLDELLPENGFNVARALVGSEGTCASVLEATVRLVHSPQHRVTVLLAYPDVFAAADHVPEIMGHEPIGLEGFNFLLTENMAAKNRLTDERARLPEGGAWLLAEFGGESHEEATERAREAYEALEGSGGADSVRLVDDLDEQAMVWTVRTNAVGDSRVPGALEAEGNWEDAAVHPDNLGSYLRDFQSLLDEHGYRCVYYGHFGQGCVHTRMDFDLKTAAGIKNFRSFMEKAADLVVSYGGSLAGEYGEGQGRSELLPKMFGPELMDAFREFKRIWDPDGKMNPARLIDAPPFDEDLRLGTDYNPAQPETHFAFPEDRGSFAKATERCFGMGKCRNAGGLTMCPSYQVTREEKHTTRGRARLLFEMLQGETVTGGWRDEAVRESLDLCLACKGCKGDCPVNVDMATYKAEFLSHYYEGRFRPMSAYATGLIYWWSRLASRIPGIANLLTQTPPLSSMMKRVAGIAPERTLPAFASKTFKQWFHERSVRNLEGTPVLLWPDTFNNHFYPETAEAAVEVLEDAGYRVEVPERPLCCGRPLYDFGMLDLAKRQLRQILDVLRPRIRAGVPVVGLEPSCIAVFRDELPNLFPNDEDARRLERQAFLLSEFLEKEGYEPPTRLEREAVVHGHCHHKAVMGLSDEHRMLEKLGLDYQLLDSGCCGMAGSWGYEEDHYEVSIKAGERVLLPTVREAGKSTLILTDGFSCREQIEQNTDRRALHLSQILQMALRNGDASSGEYPESGYFKEKPLRPGPRTATIAGAAVVLVTGTLALILKRKTAS